MKLVITTNQINNFAVLTDVSSSLAEAQVVVIEEEKLLRQDISYLWLAEIVLSFVFDLWQLPNF